MSQQIPRDTPYVAPGAPTSPLLLAVASLLVALASLVAAWLGFELPVDPTTAGALAGFLGAAWGFVQNYLARREQARGVAPLTAAVVMAPPAGPEGVAEALGSLREAARGRGSADALAGLAEPTTKAALERLAERLAVDPRPSAAEVAGRLRRTTPVPLPPEPRLHPPSGALFGSGLLDGDGEPVSAGDLDSGDDPDPDQSTERVDQLEADEGPP